MLGLLQLLSAEVSVIKTLWYFDSTNVNFCLCGDHIDLVDSSQRAGIEGKWTWKTMLAMVGIAAKFSIQVAIHLIKK